MSYGTKQGTVLVGKVALSKNLASDSLIKRGIILVHWIGIVCKN